MTTPESRPEDCGTATAAWRRDEHVIAVDRDDNEVGFVSRTDAHGPDCELHRAFMMFLVDEAGRLLLCRRSEHKRLWPGHWADSCAGHPRPGEDIADAAVRHLQEELACTADLVSLGSFVYKARFEQVGWEHELCHVFAGRACGDVTPDPSEVSEIAFFDPRHVEILIRERSHGFAPWLAECLRVFPASSFGEAVNARP